MLRAIITSGSSIGLFFVVTLLVELQFLPNTAGKRSYIAPILFTFRTANADDENHRGFLKASAAPSPIINISEFLLFENKY